MTEPAKIKNVMTVDVEDYFQVNAFSRVIRYQDWERYPSTVERNTRRILDLFDKASDGSARGTFFILGWIAERFPGLIKEIAARGHEIACHGYAHQLIFSQSREQFREDVRKAKDILEEIVGTEVIGYRAPTYSITEKTIWAVDILWELGFRYDSSIFPIVHDVYGCPDAPRYPFWIKIANGDLFGSETLRERISMPESKCEPWMPHDTERMLVEFPISTFRFVNRNIPVAGGGYFRLIPYGITERLLESINRKESKPFFFYLHPWEIDRNIPKIRSAGVLSTFRTYVNLNKTQSRLKKLLSKFRFCPFADFI